VLERRPASGGEGGRGVAERVIQIEEDGAFHSLSLAFFRRAPPLNDGCSMC
jgi:hypothetical protein